MPKNPPEENAHSTTTITDLVFPTDPEECDKVNEEIGALKATVDQLQLVVNAYWEETNKVVPPRVGQKGLSDDSAQAYTIDHTRFTIDVSQYRSGWKYKFVEENEEDEWTRTFTVHAAPHGIDLMFSRDLSTCTRTFTYELPESAWDIIKAKIEAHSDVSKDGKRYTARAAPAETQVRPVYRFDC